jgi:hypothetical protein
MTLIVKRLLVCPCCGLPYVEYQHGTTTYGFAFTGEALSHNSYINTYCWVCEDYVSPQEVSVIYTPDGRLFTLLCQYAEGTMYVYNVPCTADDNAVHFTDDEPILIAQLTLNQFTESLLATVTDVSLPDEDRLQALNILLGESEDVKEHAC